MSTHPIDELLERYIYAKRQRDGWDVELKDLSQRLEQLHGAGEVPSKISHRGWAFRRSEGRDIWAYDEDVKLAVKSLQTQAQKEGRATHKLGSPFWTCSSPKQ